MNLQLDHFSDVQYLKTPRGARAPARPLSHSKNNFTFCRSTSPLLSKGAGGVEHGSHNVSRWMTWLSISLKNAAACDKWYQLQNHFITESLNANGAWEKPFVGHPRACHTQCRTNKKSSRARSSPQKAAGARFYAFELRARAQARHPSYGARPFGLVFAVRVGSHPLDF